MSTNPDDKLPPKPESDFKRPLDDLVDTEWVSDEGVEQTDEVRDNVDYDARGKAMPPRDIKKKIE